MSKRQLLVSLLFIAVLSLLPNSTRAAAIVSGFNTSTLPANDDDSSPPVSIGFEIDLFGERHSLLHVNNNGNVTFEQELGAFTPFSLLSTNTLIIAPFFADVDTSEAGSPVTYGTGMFEGRQAFGANWVNVDYFSGTPNHANRNSFQLLLVNRSDRGDGDFDIIFNYDQIQWETGEFSGGDSNGRGGFSARAGYAIGRGAPGSSFELAGSAIPGSFLDGGPNALRSNMRNSSVPGRYIFQIRTNRATQVSALTPFANAPSIAANSDASGKFVVFVSQASNISLANGEQDLNPGADIFRIDTASGATRIVSLDNGGGDISGDASEPAVSPDGQLVFFVANDAGVNKVLGESKSAQEQRQKVAGQGVYLRNMLTGTTQRVGPASSGTAGTRPNPSSSGTHIVFTGTTTNASEGAVGQDNVYLAPMTRVGDNVTLGAAVCVSCKSVAANGSNTATNSNGQASNAVVSKDGSMVAWQSSATNAQQGVTVPCPTASTRVFARNMLTGQMMQPSAPAGGSCGASTNRVAGSGIDASANRAAYSGDGTHSRCGALCHTSTHHGSLPSSDSTQSIDRSVMMSVA